MVIGSWMFSGLLVNVVQIIMNPNEDSSDDECDPRLAAAISLAVNNFQTSVVPTVDWMCQGLKDLAIDDSQLGVV